MARANAALVFPLLALLFPLLAPSPASAARPDTSTDNRWWESQVPCLHSRLEALPWLDPAPKSRAGEFDEATGRNLLNYPPHRFVDYKSMVLEINIPDMNKPTLSAVEALTIAPIARELRSLTLNVGPKPSMDIRAVQVGGDAGVGGSGRTVTVEHTGQDLTISFEPPLPAGKDATLIVSYTLTDPPEGLTWTPESADWPGRPAQLHSQGQPESNHYWFPCHDSPNARLTTELVVTVPEGYAVCSNGHLGNARANRNAKPGAKTFDWVQDKDHVNYLVSLVVGKFDIVDIGTRDLPMPVYAPLGKGDLVKQTYGRTPDMIALFSRLTSQPFPWDKYAQVIVWNFGAGGMENTSATTLYDTAILDKTALLDGDLDGLISHELAHQWFGDLITCNSWEHIWLNEGFATYFSHLWAEHRDGPDAYLAGIRGSFEGLIANDQPDAPFQPAMVSKQWAHPWDVFRRAANPYPKGAAILHMLRQKVGDDLFFKSLALYVDRFKHKTAETDDLRMAFEEVTGLGLQRFFNQWCCHPGLPHLDVKSDYDAVAKQLTISVTQTQHIDGYNPAFYFDLPIAIKTRAGGGAKDNAWAAAPAVIRMDAKAASLTIGMDAPPEFIAVDPNLSVLADLKIDQTPDQWMAQARSGPTFASRVQAFDALGHMAHDSASLAAAADLLAGVAADSKAFFVLRTAAIGALGHMADSTRLLALADKPPADASVRRALVDNLVGVAHADTESVSSARSSVLALLTKLARNDPSYAVRAASVRGLGTLKDTSALPTILAAADAVSQHDQICQAALDALAALDDPYGLPVALRYSVPSALARTRPVAVSAIGALAHHDPDKAFAALSALMSDHDLRTVRAAGDALVHQADPRALPLLEHFAQTATSDIAKDQAKRWLKDLNAKLQPTASP